MDRELWQDAALLRDAIVSFASSAAIGRIISLGNTGYDSHPDHVTSHQAVEESVKILRGQLGRNTVHLALNADMAGSEVVQARSQVRRQKLDAMSCHASQFPIQPFNIESPDDVVVGGYGIKKSFWDSFAYKPLILLGETYDRL